MHVKLLFTLTLTLTIFACQQTESNSHSRDTRSSGQGQSDMTTSMTKTKTKQSKYSYQGTVHHFALEGGFYGIISDKGEKLLPLNLDKKYRVDGTVIAFSGVFKKDMMTIQQWGQPFVIKDVQLIRVSKKTTDPEL